MKEINLFALILRQTKTVRFLASFACVFVICTLLLWWLDPSLETYGDAIWYGFMLVTTIGFGDLKAVTLSSRLVSVFLGLYGILAIGFICGVGASWLFEKVRAQKGESVALMLHQLEHLEDLDDEQIRSLQSRARQIREEKSRFERKQEAHREDPCRDQ